MEKTVAYHDTVQLTFYEIDIVVSILGSIARCIDTNIERIAHIVHYNVHDYSVHVICYLDTLLN